MPEKILELLKSNSLTKEQLAIKLNITLSELEAAMEYLEQMGFIKSTTITPVVKNCSTGCSGSCSKCSGSCSPSSNSDYVIWEIQ